MGRIQRKRPFWSLAGPLLGYLLIRGVVEFCIQLAISFPRMMNVYYEMFEVNASPTMDDLTNAYVQAFQTVLEVVAEYQVEIASVSALCTVILTGILFAKDRKLERAYGILPPAKAPAKEYWKLLIFGAAGSVSASCLMAMAQLVLADGRYAQTSEVMYSAGLPVQLIGLGIIIPIAEEMMFRGILFRRYRENQRFWYSALCSSLIFAFMHTNTIQMIYGFLAGLMFCYLYDKFGSIKAPAFLHIVQNVSSVVCTETGVFRWLGADPIRMAGATIGGAFICSVMFVLIQRLEGFGTQDSPREKEHSDDLF